MNSDRSEPIVVFADILGFADLVLEMDRRVGHIDYAFYSATEIEQLRTEFGGRTSDPLSSAFISFHRLLDLQIESLMQVDPIESVVFSDAAYVTFRDAGVATWFAIRLMRELISFGVPVRMGISTGSFRAMRLMTDVADGLRRHSSQFLGTGVVRAYRAESCGLKGMRIFIHPEADLKEDFPGEFVSVAGSAGYRALKVPVERELNYVHEHPPWIPNKDGSPTGIEHGRLRVAVADMRNYAPAGAHIHYDETLAALDRMNRITDTRD